MNKQAEETEQVDAETLREWLDTGRPVTVIDVRGNDDYAQWTIPGSVHVNAYDALRHGEPGPLADVDLLRGSNKTAAEPVERLTHSADPELPD